MNKSRELGAFVLPTCCTETRPLVEGQTFIDRRTSCLLQSRDVSHSRFTTFLQFWTDLACSFTLSALSTSQPSCLGASLIFSCLFLTSIWVAWHSKQMLLLSCVPEIDDIYVLCVYICARYTKAYREVSKLAARTDSYKEWNFLPLRVVLSLYSGPLSFAATTLCVAFQQVFILVPIQCDRWFFCWLILKEQRIYTNFFVKFVNTVWEKH
jgi:hypothetical protein